MLALYGIAAYTDYKNRIIPNVVPVGIVFCWCIECLFMGDVDWEASLWGFSIPAIVMIIAYFKGVRVGGGDLKIVAASGLFLGIFGLAYVLLFSSISGGFYYLKTKKKSFPLATALFPAVISYYLILFLLVLQ